MRNILTLLVYCVLSSALCAQERSTVYAYDPLILQGSNFHVVVNTQEISIDAGECVIYNFIMDGAPLEFSEGFGKIKVINKNKPIVQWFTLKEMHIYALHQCWPEDLLG